MQTDPILVTAATGKTGRRVADRLAALGHDVRRASRSGPVPFHWEGPATWGPALDGAAAVYLAYAPDLAVPGGADAVAAVAAEAHRAGVRRLVLLSGRGEPGAQHGERLVGEAFPGATVVRASWFMQNFSESFMLDGIAAGELALPVGAVGEPFVDADDLADVAVAALTGDGHAGRLYECTGPRLLTFAEATRAIAEAVGRPIDSVEIPFDAFAAALREFGEPEPVVELMRHLFTEVLDGRNAHVATGVQEALGRPPRDFADYVREVAASGPWARDAAGVAAMDGSPA